MKYFFKNDWRNIVMINYKLNQIKILAKEIERLEGCDVYGFK